MKFKKEDVKFRKNPDINVWYMFIPDGIFRHREIYWSHTSNRWMIRDGILCSSEQLSKNYDSEDFKGFMNVYRNKNGEAIAEIKEVIDFIHEPEPLVIKETMHYSIKDETGYVMHFSTKEAAQTWLDTHNRTKHIANLAKKYNLSFHTAVLLIGDFEEATKKK